MRNDSSYDGIEDYFNRIGYKAYYIYISIHKFKINVREEFYCVASIGLIRKDTGYTKRDIYNAMKLLIKYKLIKVHNVSRWDRFLTEKQIPDKQVLEVQLLPISDENKISPFNSELFQYYLDNGLNIKHFMIHKVLLLDKGLTIEDIADRTGFDGETVNKHIRQMNRKYVVYSEYVRGSKYVNNKFEHHVMKSVKDVQQFMDKYKEATDRNIARWDKKTIVYNDSAL